MALWPGRSFLPQLSVGDALKKLSCLLQVKRLAAPYYTSLSFSVLCSGGVMQCSVVQCSVV